jgi:hypothetical protein
VAFPCELWSQTDEGQLALARFAKVELEDSDVRSILVHDGEQLDLFVPDDCCELLVVHDQTGKPKPRRAHEPE